MFQYGSTAIESVRWKWKRTWKVALAFQLAFEKRQPTERFFKASTHSMLHKLYKSEQPFRLFSFSYPRMLAILWKEHGKNASNELNKSDFCRLQDCCEFPGWKRVAAFNRLCVCVFMSPFVNFSNTFWWRYYSTKPFIWNVFNSKVISLDGWATLCKSFISECLFCSQSLIS